MELIKQIFPLAFATKTETKDLIINLVLHLIGWVVLYVLGVIFSWLELPLISTIFGFFSDLIKLYLGASAIISVLDYLKVFKD